MVMRRRLTMNLGSTEQVLITPPPGIRMRSCHVLSGTHSRPRLLHQMGCNHWLYHKMSGAYPHFQDYYDNESRSDVVLCFANKRIHAHKLILAGASELFHTAFKSNFQVHRTRPHTFESLY